MRRSFPPGLPPNALIGGRIVLRKAAVPVLKRIDLPEDLIERTKTLPNALFEYAAEFAQLSDGDRVLLRKAFKELADFPVGEFDKLTGAGAVGFPDGPAHPFGDGFRLAALDAGRFEGAGGGEGVEGGGHVPGRALKAAWRRSVEAGDELHGGDASASRSAPTAAVTG